MVAPRLPFRPCGSCSCCHAATTFNLTGLQGAVKQISFSFAAKHMFHQQWVIDFLHGLCLLIQCINSYVSARNFFFLASSAKMVKMVNS
jgi:hypothetical protein